MVKKIRLLWHPSVKESTSNIYNHKEDWHKMKLKNLTTVLLPSIFKNPW